MRSSALDRAKALLSGQRLSNTDTANARRDAENSSKLMTQTKQKQFLDLSDISPSVSEKQDLTKSFVTGDGSRFLKKTSKNAPEDRLSSAPSGTPAGTDDFKFIPQRSSQSVALSRLALIENRIRNQKNKGDSPRNQTHPSEPQEPRLSVQSSSDPSRFLKKTVSAPQEEKVPERTSVLDEHKGRRISLDSDEQDMKILLGDSFSLSEGSLQDAPRQKSPQPVKQLYKKSSEKATVPSAAPERDRVLDHRRLSPSLSRSESRMVRFTERSVSSDTDPSEIRSLDDLFPVALDSDDNLSERSAVLDDFKLNVMTLDDLAPIPFAAAETSQEKKETQAKKEDQNKRSSDDISKVVSRPMQEETSAAYESDFESEISSETPPSASEISEHLTDEAKDTSLISEAQYSSHKSQGDDNDDDRTLSPSSSRHSDSSSRSSSSNATVTNRTDRHMKEVAVQTHVDGFTYTWSSGMAAAGPSLGMTYVDPTPIASHTVSAEAIESLTAYNPAILALNDMLRQQLALTRSFIDSTRRHYQSVLESLEPADYKYTTLQDTKEFIRAHRPPKLSVEDAVQEVLQEMQDYNYT